MVHHWRSVLRELELLTHTHTSTLITSLAITLTETGFVFTVDNIDEIHMQRRVAQEMRESEESNHRLCTVWQQNSGQIPYD